MLNKKLFTSESVTEGHPDKLCDQVSDGVLDAILSQDPNAHVACETCATTGMVMVMGEISTTARVDVPSIVRETVKTIGLTTRPAPCSPPSMSRAPTSPWALTTLWKTAKAARMLTT